MQKHATWSANPHDALTGRILASRLHAIVSGGVALRGWVRAAAAGALLSFGGALLDDGAAAATQSCSAINRGAGAEDGGAGVAAWSDECARFYAHDFVKQSVDGNREDAAVEARPLGTVFGVDGWTLSTTWDNDEALRPAIDVRFLLDGVGDKSTLAEREEKYQEELAKEGSVEFKDNDLYKGAREVDERGSWSIDLSKFSDGNWDSAMVLFAGKSDLENDDGDALDEVVMFKIDFTRDVFGRQNFYTSMLGRYDDKGEVKLEKIDVVQLYLRREEYSFEFSNAEGGPSPVPAPPALLLLGSAIGIGALIRRRRVSKA